MIAKSNFILQQRDKKNYTSPNFSPILATSWYKKAFDRWEIGIGR
jgi:hypothetical protein